MIKLNLTAKIKKIKLILLDVDGVLTNGSVILGDSNQDIKIFNIHDGLGIKLAQAGGIEMGIISGRTSEAVTKRADELNIKILYQDQHNKLEAFEQIKSKQQLNDEQIAYIGDDLLDLKILQKVGLSIAVNNACNEVKNEVDYITISAGGKGAVREVIELILKEQGKWQDLIRSFYDF